MRRIREDKLDFRLMCTWLLPACEPGSSVGLQLANGEKGEQEKAKDFASGIGAFGLSVAPIPNCDVLLAVENDIGREKDYSRMLEEFGESRAQKMYLFCLNWLAKSALEKALHDTNWLDRSILLPGRAVNPSLQTQYSLLILDKTRRDANDRTARRDANDRTKILFIDASGMDIEGLRTAAEDGDRDAARQIVENAESDLPRAEKDFRDVPRWNEPLLASYHCARRGLENVLGDSTETIGDYVEIIKCPSFLHPKGDEKLTELSCLSPKDFAPYGYTSAPSAAEKKSFPKVRPEQFLRPDDILLVSQSNVGKLCIIDHSFEKNSWTGSSFTWIIRPNYRFPLDPRALYIYLASAAVNGFLAACSCGSALPLLPVQSFRNLPAPDFCAVKHSFMKEEHSHMIKCFERLDEIRSQVKALSSEARALLSDSYGVSRSGKGLRDITAPGQPSRSGPA